MGLEEASEALRIAYCIKAGSNQTLQVRLDSVSTVSEPRSLVGDLTKSRRDLRSL